MSHYLERFCKDSLNKFDTLNVERYDRDTPEGTMIAVGNQLIRSNAGLVKYDDCWEDYPYPLTETDRAIVFLNDDMSIKNRLLVGKRCANDGEGIKNMHYINPDSIYYAYITQPEYIGSTISIANFSWDGKLNLIIRWIWQKICCRFGQFTGVKPYPMAEYLFQVLPTRPL